MQYPGDGYRRSATCPAGTALTLGPKLPRLASVALWWAEIFMLDEENRRTSAPRTCRLVVDAIHNGIDINRRPFTRAQGLLYIDHHYCRIYFHM